MASHLPLLFLFFSLLFTGRISALISFLFVCRPVNKGKEIGNRRQAAAIFLESSSPDP